MARGRLKATENAEVSVDIDIETWWHVCPVCQEVFVSLRGLSQHINSKHDDQRHRIGYMPSGEGEGRYADPVEKAVRDIMGVLDSMELAKAGYWRKVLEHIMSIYRIEIRALDQVEGPEEYLIDGKPGHVEPEDEPSDAPEQDTEIEEEIEL